MSKPRYTIGEWSGRENFECNHCAFATLDRGQIIRHVRAEHGTPGEIAARGPLHGVDFASDEAAELASSEGLTAGEFRFTPSGQGGFTVADVRSAVKAVTTEEE